MTDRLYITFGKRLKGSDFDTNIIASDFSRVNRFEQKLSQILGVQNTHNLYYFLGF